MSVLRRMRKAPDAGDTAAVGTALQSGLGFGAAGFRAEIQGDNGLA